jgi:hypothetical protein
VLTNTLVPVETSSKVVTGPLASGDPQVKLSHVECLPQAIALDQAGPLVALLVSPSTRVALRGSREASTTPLTIFSGAPHKLPCVLRRRSHHQAV